MIVFIARLGVIQVGSLELNFLQKFKHCLVIYFVGAVGCFVEA